MKTKTVLHDIHCNMGAKMIDFAGHRMPVQYSSIIEEHRAVRRAAGLFDVSHMGEIRLSGAGSRELLDYLFTNELRYLAEGQVKYSPMANVEGGTIDDLLVYCCGPEEFLLVVNAINLDQDREHIGGHAAGFEGVKVADESGDTALLALQGPRSEEILEPVVDIDLEQLGGFEFARGTLAVPSGERSQEVLLSRTGYTGEDGFEVFISSPGAPVVWKTLLDRGKPLGLKPAGLGARDTLRLEAALPLYGHELDEEISPLTAGLGWAVRLEKSDFVGREALVEEDREGSPLRLIGLKMCERGVARSGYPVYLAGEEKGRITSGSYSPACGVGIALAYVPTGLEDEKPLEVGIRGRRCAAERVRTPFITNGE